MAINIIGAIAVVSVYWAIWYAAGALRAKLPSTKDIGLKALWMFNAAALFGSGACFFAAGILNRDGSLRIEDGNGSLLFLEGGAGQAQAIAILIILIVFGTLGLVTVKRTARVKAAEVAAASVPRRNAKAADYANWPVVGASITPAFSERLSRSRAESIIDEIKGTI